VEEDGDGVTTTDGIVVLVEVGCESFGILVLNQLVEGGRREVLTHEE